LAPLAALDALKGIGVTLVIDDFGTGFSSFALLKRVHPQHLKIDRSFIADLSPCMRGQLVEFKTIAMRRAPRAGVSL
jgi:diguanylate cyclase